MDRWWICILPNKSNDWIVIIKSIQKLISVVIGNKEFCAWRIIKRWTFRNFGIQALDLNISPSSSPYNVLPFAWIFWGDENASCQEYESHNMPYEFRYTT